MFFVLRNKLDQSLLHKQAEDGVIKKARPGDLDQAMLFNMVLQPELSDEGKTSTGRIEAKIMDGWPVIPAGLDYEWEIVPVDLKLAGPSHANPTRMTRWTSSWPGT